MKSCKQILLKICIYIIIYMIDILTCYLLIQHIILDAILCFTVNQYVSSYFIINIIFIDSFIESINFVISRYKKQSCFFIFKYTVLARYIYYIILAISFYIIEILIWFKYDLIYLKILSSSPYLINFVILKLRFNRLENIIVNKYKDSIINLLSKALSKTINFISKNSLNIDPKIKYFEIKPFVSRANYLAMFFNFLNTFLLVSYLYYLKKIGYIYSSRLIKKYLFKFKKFTPNNIHIKKIYISKILTSRQWEYLLKPQTLDIILKIYMNGKDDNKQILKFFIKHINLFKIKLKNCLYSWTIASFLKISYLTNFISILLIKTKYDFKDIICLICSYIFFFFIKFNNFLLSSIISEFLPIILFSNITKEIYKEIYKKIYELLVNIYNIYNFHILSILLTISTSFIFFKFFIMSIIFFSLFLLFLFKTKYFLSFQSLFIIALSNIFFSYFSSNIYHIIIIPIIIDIVYNVYLINYIINKNDEEETNKLLASFYIQKVNNSLLIKNYIQNI